MQPGTKKEIRGSDSLATIQLLNSSLQRLGIGVGDGAKAAELASVVISRECNVLDLAVLFDNRAEDHLVDAVRDVAIEER